VPIATTDLLLKLSITTGTAGNQAAQPNPNLSLGKYISTTQVVDNTLNNLFDDISGDENAAGAVDYRCVFFHNAHATLTWLAPVVWISAEVAGGANTAIAVDNIAASAVGATAAQAAVIATETTAPTGVGAFSSPTTKATGLALGDIGPGQCRAVWVRRTAQNSAAINNDGMTLRGEGDSLA
jgi:hypothetical protein